MDMELDQIEALLEMGICPICGECFKRDIWRGEGYIEEEYETCPNKHYSYSYIYGSTDIWAGDQQWGYWHTATFDEILNINTQVLDALQKMRKKD